ncbi:MAG TPA: hypothetical protein GXX38_09365 [Clostridia bacterium]|jgi:hypothetical protein|nr:hypothetical protein [Clostridia bacterium]
MSKLLFAILKVVGIIFIIFLIATFAANQIFKQKVRKEVRDLFDVQEGREREIVTEKDLDKLPSCVKRWLTNIQVIGKEKIRTVRLKQKGLIRTKEGQPWMPFEAEQYVAVDRPGFIWYVKVKAAPLIYLSGRDIFYQARGNMLIKLLSIITVADGKGKEIDQGSLVRYLAEISWYPTAVLSDYIKWEEIDDNSAKATITVEDVTASGIFYFDQNGNFFKFRGERYKEEQGSYSLGIFAGYMTDYQEFKGIILPSLAEARWELPEGDFSYFQGRIGEIEYNKAEFY